VRGLAFELGILTNLRLLEHLDYHGSFRAYVAAKARFFRQLAPAAPVVHPAADLAARELVRREWPAAGRVGVGAAGRVRLAVRRARWDGPRPSTAFTLSWRRPLPGAAGAAEVPPGRLELVLPLLGRTQVENAALAAVAGRCLGADADAVAGALAAAPRPRRRLEVLHRGAFTVLDDTVGHPDSISAVFQVAERLPHRRLHVAMALRGGRGAQINRRDAEALAIWARRVPVATLVATTAADEVTEPDRVTAAERRAFLEPLARAGLPAELVPELAPAVRRVLARAGRRDLVLLLGAQGMNGGAAALEAWLAEG
jgi:UDP-N-acetylmuramoyl-L-alanyl-D-glutamate--2,6-diaminopimelate ligase